ncbi:MAG TPA: DUF1990 domain-containing protein [Acidimicrobiales bacterium]|nr:DUF1990 domain-containing protein [Acidimicrobiales bacterium]
MIWSLGRPSQDDLRRAVERDADSSLTYDAIGATLDRTPVAGFANDEWSTALDPGAFERAGDALLSWGAQQGAGMMVWPDQPVHEGLTFALALPMPIGFVIATGRVVWVVRSEDEIGFAYGTLPSHPECGEEAFAVTRDRFDVWAFSRPRDPLARLGRPVARVIQRQANERYLAAMRAV